MTEIVLRINQSIRTTEIIHECTEEIESRDSGSPETFRAPSRILENRGTSGTELCISVGRLFLSIFVAAVTVVLLPYLCVRGHSLDRDERHSMMESWLTGIAIVLALQFIALTSVTVWLIVRLKKKRD